MLVTFHFGISILKNSALTAGKGHFLRLLEDVRKCRTCEPFLPLGCKPIFQIHQEAKILLVGQAPGRRVHETGIPFNDPSGDRLRNWLGIDRMTFYNEQRIALLPMGFCYPGTGKGGDLPPRKECAEQWRNRLLACLNKIELTVVIGQYARDWHLPEERKLSMAESVAGWRQHWPQLVVLPHPSPRNIRWFRNNPWLEAEIVPVLQDQVARIISGQT